MLEDKMMNMVVIAILGIFAQWVAWRLSLPSILLLLVFGIAAGITHVVDPNWLLGDLLLPVVSLSVALILYEGGLTLRLKELGAERGAVRNLVTIGALVALVGGSASAYFLFDLSPVMAMMIGAIFIVTGPTVVGPLLRQVRPIGSVGPILKWEGIVTDPLGAMLAVLFFEVLLSGHLQEAPMHTVIGIAKTFLIGGVSGGLGAWLLWALLKRHLVADHLQNPISIMLVFMVFGVGNQLQHEAGLLGVTVMGMLLANQRSAPVGHIIEFKENLRVLLISALFILLAARLEMKHLQSLGWQHFAFLASLILVVRPAQVFLSTHHSKLTVREKLFLCAVAPRGIVAAAVASVLGLELAENGYAEAELVVPLTFLVIIGTVTVYGLAAAPVAYLLGLSGASRKGLLLLGAHKWGLSLARVLHESGCQVMVVDSNRRNIMQARLEGLPAFHGNLLAEHALDEIDLRGVGRLIALTPNDEVNALACHHLEELFGRSEVYQLVVAQEAETDYVSSMGGRRLFGESVTYHSLELLRRRGGVFEAITVDSDFNLDRFMHKWGDNATPLFVVSENGNLRVLVAGEKASVSAGERLVVLIVRDPSRESQLDSGAAPGSTEAGAAESLSTASTPAEPKPVNSSVVASSPAAANAASSTEEATTTEA